MRLIAFLLIFAVAEIFLMFGANRIGIKAGGIKVWLAVRIAVIAGIVILLNSDGFFSSDGPVSNKQADLDDYDADQRAIVFGLGFLMVFAVLESAISVFFVRLGSRRLVPAR